MRTGAALLLAALALAGCGGVSEGEALKQREQAKAAELAKLQGWDRAFRPEAAIAAANQFGLRVVAYTTAPKGYQAIGGPVMISSSASGLANQVSFKGTGASAELMDTLSFELAVQDARAAADARKRFADLIRDFLFQSKIDAKPIHDAIAKGNPGEGDLAGARYTIAKPPRDTVGVERLTVTFNRTGASAPTNS